MLIWLVATQMLALVAIWQLQSTPVIKLLLLLLSILLGVREALRHLVVSSRSAIRQVTVTHDAGWQLVMGNGDRLQVRLMPESFIKPWLIVLCFKTQSFAFPKTLVLFPDSLDKTDARQLRIYLKRQATEPLRFPEHS